LIEINLPPNKNGEFVQLRWKEEKMPKHNSAHFFLNWSKERIDEMDAALVSLEATAGKVQADLRAKAERALAELRNSRDHFRDTVRKLRESDETAWTGAMARLEPEWIRFESDVKKYVENFSKELKQQQEIFKLQADAQLKAWREAADKLQTTASQFAVTHRKEVDATVARLKAEAVAAEARLRKLGQTGGESWATYMAALAETRSVFDRANQSAREAFKKAAA
jgi:ElaB/YqjD/DUF883 family membrane-anchored ribosome-binding protein